MSIKFSANEIRYIALFENMTGAMVKDCIIDDEHGKVTFVVKNGDMGLAIGKKGSSVSKVQRAVDKGVVAEMRANGTEDTVMAYAIDLKDRVDFKLSDPNGPKASWWR